MNMKRMGAWCGIIAGIQFIIITFGIMLFYPEGYSFLENTFSSLGYSVTKGYPTPLNWLFFATATTLAGALSIPFWLTLRTVFTETALQRGLSWVATILGLVSAPCLAGVGIFAADLYGLQHGLSTILFFILVALGIGVYSVVILLNTEYPNTYSLVGIITGVLCILYILVIHGAAMQKVAVYAIILYTVFQGYELLKIFEKTEPIGNVQD
ncbi:MAG: hypothetical protein P1Q69_08940 [Candidatus Thorarchaeota archaeon]|nr:hypothetical protein [Candidatus Thorarchaeota archaeon]